MKTIIKIKIKNKKLQPRNNIFRNCSRRGLSAAIINSNRGRWQQMIWTAEMLQCCYRASNSGRKVEATEAALAYTTAISGFDWQTVERQSLQTDIQSNNNSHNFAYVLWICNFYKNNFIFGSYVLWMLLLMPGLWLPDHLLLWLMADGCTHTVLGKPKILFNVFMLQQWVSV